MSTSKPARLTRDGVTIEVIYPDDIGRYKRLGFVEVVEEPDEKPASKRRHKSGAESEVTDDAKNG
jgi:hypothetical protein